MQRRIWVAALVAALVGGGQAFAALAGDLDTSFSGAGKVSLDVGGADEVNDIEILPDGKILVAGGIADEFALLRFNPSGSLDTTFGNDATPGDGRVVTNINVIAAVPTIDSAEAIEVQPDGKIVAAGGANSDIALVRYNSDGSLDTTGFGGGDGKFSADFGGSQSPRDVALDGSRIVVAGDSNDDFFVSRHIGTPGATAGMLDVTFDPNNGRVFTDVNAGSIDSAYSILVRPGPTYLVGGSAGNALALLRYIADGGNSGDLDTTFGNDGTNNDGKTLLGSGAGLDFARATSMALTPDGRIVTGGDHTGAYLVARFASDGALDTSFSSDGLVTTPLINSNGAGGAVALQPDGKILLAVTGGGDFGLLRYTPSGQLDPSFSGDGVQTTDIQNSDFVTDLALQADGRALIGGISDDLGNTDVALARYLTSDDPPPATGAAPPVRKCRKGFRLKTVKKKGKKKKKCVRRKKKRRK